MATRAEQLAELQTELTQIKAAMTSARSSSTSFSVDGLSVSNRNMAELREERTRIEKSIQRLLRGGRGFVIDLSDQNTDETDVINTTYTQVGA
jgi:phage shock protein A